jgi:hypothetical protein
MLGRERRGLAGTSSRVSGPCAKEVTVPLARLVAVAALALLAACSSSPAAPVHTGPSTQPAGSTTIGFTDKGRTITVAAGAQVVVTLDSTYWNFEPLSSKAVVVASRPTYRAAGGHPVPGSGAGTVREVLRAVGAGTATITAQRSSCGEAMRCVGGLGTFQVTVVVR